MTNAIYSNMIVTLANGLNVKGSYRSAMRGAMIDLYVMDKNGRRIASRNLGLIKCHDPHAALKALVMALATLMIDYKIDELTETRIIDAAVPSIVAVFDKDIALDEAA